MNKMDQIFNILECPICLEYYDSEDRKPIILWCSHNLCFTCYNQKVDKAKTSKRKKDTFICPLDKKPVDFKKNKPILNLTLMSIAEIAKKAKNIEDNT